MSINKLVKTKLFSEDIKDTFSVDNNKLQLDFNNSKLVSVDQGYFGVNKDGTISGDKRDGYGNSGLIKQYKSPSAALYTSGMHLSDKEEGDLVGYIGRIKEVELIPVILKKKRGL